MAANATSWTKGRSGNPSGRAKNPASRRSLRAALSAPASPGSDECLMDRWAREMIAGAVTLDDRLALLRFLDGASPTFNDFAVSVETPRIVVPSDDPEADEAARRGDRPRILIHGLTAVPPAEE